MFQAQIGESFVEDQGTIGRKADFFKENARGGVTLVVDENV